MNTSEQTHSMEEIPDNIPITQPFSPDDWSKYFNEGLEANLFDLPNSQTTSPPLTDTFMSLPQAAFQPIPQNGTYEGMAPGELRMQLLLLLSRLDSIERVITRVDTAIENIKGSLLEFSKDVVGLFRGYGILSAGEPENEGLEMV
ncbi:hypothetical protein DL768_010480 [Monosporascus sp. mg162]|nr:hypothetical protein DL768_010480 [Monosporascus sp. mg162]